VKRCNKCDSDKDLSEFFNSSYTKDGKQNQCKSCRYKYQSERNKRLTRFKWFRKRRNKYNADYYKKRVTRNPEKMKSYKRSRYLIMKRQGEIELRKTGNYLHAVKNENES
jgi:hypothetical protein